MLIIAWYVAGFWLAIRRYYRNRRGVGVSSGSPPAVKELFDLLLLGLLMGAQPRVYRQLRLWQFPISKWPGFIFPQEQVLWHDTFSALPNSSGRETLRNKQAFSELAERCGIKTPRILQVIPKGSKVNLDSLNTSHDVFLKPAHGHGGRGCARLSKSPCSLVGLSVDGFELNTECLSTIQAELDKLLDLDALIVQEILTNDPVLATVAATPHLVTFRVVTELVDRIVHIRYAIMEVPSEEGNAWTFSDIDHDGHITGSSHLLPFWTDAKRIVAAAHLQVSDLRAVGWDLCYSRKSVMLIEGNAIWGVLVPQRTAQLSAYDAGLYRSPSQSLAI